MTLKLFFTPGACSLSPHIALREAGLAFELCLPITRSGHLDNVVLTPHYSGAHPGYVQRASAIFIDNLARFVSGEALINVVDRHAGY